MANQPEETRFPTLPDGWADGAAPASTPTHREKPAAADPRLARWEKQRRDITSAMVVFLLAGVVFVVLDYRSLVTATLGVAAGWSIRLLLLEGRITRLRECG